MPLSELEPLSYLPVLLTRLIGSEDEQDLLLPLPVLVNLAKGRFEPVYRLLMWGAVAKRWDRFEGRLPWDTTVGGYYSPENSPSHTFGFAIHWPDGLGWMNEHFKAAPVREHQILDDYAQLSESKNQEWGQIYSVTEPLVALFFALCYAAERGVSGNEAWLHTVATSQRIRWEALLESELYRSQITARATV